MYILSLQSQTIPLGKKSFRNGWICCIKQFLFILKAFNDYHQITLQKRCVQSHQRCIYVHPHLHQPWVLLFLKISTKFDCPALILIFTYSRSKVGLSWQLSGKESACQYRRHGFDPCSMPHASEQLSPSTTTAEPVPCSPRTATAEAQAPCILCSSAREAAVMGSLCTTIRKQLLLPATREKPVQPEDPAQPTINKQNYKTGKGAKQGKRFSMELKRI